MNIKTIITLLLFMILHVACKKEDNSNTKELLAGRCRVSCTLGGAVSGTYNSDDANSFSAYNSVFMVLDAVNINNSTSIRQNVSLYFPVNISAGTYHLNDSSAPNILFSYLKKNIYVSDDKTWNAGIGSDFTFTITKVSYSEIEGTFYGTANNILDGSTITFTNGKFRTTFIH